MSQDIKRERAGVRFETIAGATNYITQLEAENKRLKAQVHSLTHDVNPGSTVPFDAMPDDTEINQAIEEAESFNEAVCEIAEKYDVPVTGNMERWQDGVFVRHAAEFTNDLHRVADRFVGRQAWDRGYLAGRSDAYADVYDAANPYE